jgi:hypothetical protein
MGSFSTRLTSLIIALVLGYFILGWFQSAWMNYWLLTDGERGLATVINENWSGHQRVVYRYVVNQKDYTGLSYRNREDQRYSNVQPGDESIVYFSVSHPWLSQLNKPYAVSEGWPILLILLPLEFFAVLTFIKPGSKWAFNLSGGKGNHTA